jgi:hypothetical protein
MSESYNYYGMGPDSEALVAMVELPYGEGEVMVAVMRVPWSPRPPRLSDETIESYVAFAEDEIATSHDMDEAVRVVVAKLMFSSRYPPPPYPSPNWDWSGEEA